MGSRTGRLTVAVLGLKKFAKDSVDEAFTCSEVSMAPPFWPGRVT